MVLSEFPLATYCAKIGHVFLEFIPQQRKSYNTNKLYFFHLRFYDVIVQSVHIYWPPQSQVGASISIENNGAWS